MQPQNKKIDLDIHQNLVSVRFRTKSAVSVLKPTQAYTECCMVSPQQPSLLLVL